MARWRAVMAIVVVGLALGARQQAALGSARTLTRAGESGAAHVSAPDGVRDLDLVISSRITTAPSYVMSIVRPTPNPDNRLLRVTVDAPGFTRTTTVALDGTDAPAICRFYWRDLQPGLYHLVATVHGASGAVLAHRRLTFAVVPGASDE